MYNNILSWAESFSMKIIASRATSCARFSSFKPEPYTGVSKEEIWKLHQQHMFPFYKPYYK